MFKLGINTNNDCEKDLTKNLKLIKQAGFDCVMISFKSGNLEEGLIEAKKLGLDVPYVHLTSTDYLWCKGVLNKNFINLIKEQISVCKKFNVHIAVMHATNGQANQLALPPNKHGLNSFKEILEHAKNCNVTIALENLDKPNFKHFKYLMKKIKHPNLKFCYDAGHHNLYNPKNNLLKKYGKFLVAVHLHDNFMNWKFGYDWTRDLHLLPLDGKVNYNEICNNLAKTNYNNALMLEVHKTDFGNANLYNELTAQQYLSTAYERAKTLANKITEIKKIYKR